MKNEGAAIAIIPRVLAHFEMGGASNVRDFKKAMARMMSRYHCYRENGYGRIYMVECVAIEIMKAFIG